MWQRRDWACGKNKGSLHFPNKLTLPLLQVNTLARVLAINPDFPWVCVFCVCVWQESRELMRQACGGPPALSQINHAADPVPSAWGPNRACMLSLSHGPGPLSSPQHNSSGVEGGLGGGTPQNALLPFLSSFSFCGHQEIDAGREKQKRPSHLPSAAAATTAPFYCLSEGPFGNGQALRGGGGGGSFNLPTSFDWLVSWCVITQDI